MNLADFREANLKLAEKLRYMEVYLSKIYSEQRGWKAANKRSRPMATALRKQLLEWRKISIAYEKEN